MAHTCVSTAASSLRFKSLALSGNPSSSLDYQKLSLPFEPLRSRKLKKLVTNRKSSQHTPAKAIYS
ncbi:hypothetical protein CRG98_031460, partial [Punica granatum]